MSQKTELFEDAPDGPMLVATRCQQCRYVDFPPQDYGCRSCGAFGADLVDARIPAVGNVVTSATVFSHPDPKHETPFTVAVVSLAEGPVTRVVMRETAPLQIGEQIHGEVVTVGDEPTLRFAKTGT